MNNILKSCDWQSINPYRQPAKTHSSTHRFVEMQMAKHNSQTQTKNLEQQRLQSENVFNTYMKGGISVIHVTREQQRVLMRASCAYNSTINPAWLSVRSVVDAIDPRPGEQTPHINRPSPKD